MGHDAAGLPTAVEFGGEWVSEGGGKGEEGECSCQGRKRMIENADILLLQDSCNRPVT